MILTKEQGSGMDGSLRKRCRMGCRHGSTDGEALCTREGGGDGGAARREQLRRCPEVFPGKGNQKGLNPGWSWYCVPAEATCMH